LDYADGVDPEKADSEMLGEYERISNCLGEVFWVDLSSSRLKVIFCCSGQAVALAPAVAKSRVLRGADVFLICDVESGALAVQSDVYDSCWESWRGGGAGLLWISRGLPYTDGAMARLAPL